jgi:hypothetical protein
MDSPTDINNRHIFLVILSVIVTRYLFFILSFPTVIPSVVTDEKNLSVNTEANNKEILHR